MLIPVARGTPTSSGVGFTSGLLTGTAERKGARVDVWVRHTETREEVMRLHDGTVFKIDGVDQTFAKATGAYELHRQTIDCSARSVRTYEVVTYKETGGPPVTESSSRDGRMNPVVPGSVGEAIVDFACQLY